MKKAQQLQGKVVSTKMAKTIVVEVARMKQHPKYKKYIRVTKRYKAHVEGDMPQDGERVIIEATPPLSREKRWKLVKENV